MLAGDRRRAKLPNDLSGLARNANHGGGRPVAGEDIAVRQFLDTVTLSPQRPGRLDLDDAVSHRIKMLPGAPLPNGLSCRSQFRQVIRVHPVGVSFRSGSILAR